MNGKIISVLLVIFSVVQSFEASTNNIQPRISDEHVADFLKDLVAKIQKDLKNIREEVRHFDNKIKQSLNEINVTELLANLEKKIEDITEESHISLIEAIKCLAMQQQEVEDLEKTANEGTEKCSKEVKPIKDEITQEVSEVKAKAQDVVSDITIGTWKCYFDNVSTPAKVLPCLLKLVAPATAAVGVVTADMRAAGVRFQQLAEHAIQNVTECVVQLQKELVRQENIILEDFQKCVM